jgi:hypothetical protein
MRLRFCSDRNQNFTRSDSSPSLESRSLESNVEIKAQNLFNLSQNQLDYFLHTQQTLSA